MDLINRNELNKKILELMSKYVEGEWSEGIEVCSKILMIIAEMPSKKESYTFPLKEKNGTHDDWWNHQLTNGITYRDLDSKNVPTNILKDGDEKEN